MAKRLRVSNEAQFGRRNSHLAILAISVVVIKLLVMLQLQDGSWPGADAENYIGVADDFEKRGLFADGLMYWPPGYPLVILMLRVLTGGHELWALSVLQTLAWSAAVFFAARQLLRSRIAVVAVPIAYFALLNPTLSLASLTIGYETFTASCALVALGLLLHERRADAAGEAAFWQLPVAALALGWASMLQARLALGGAAFLVAWVLLRRPVLLRWAVTLIAVFAFALPPGLLVARNLVANGQPVITTQLGINMLMGVGDEAPGYYTGGKTYIACNVDESDSVLADKQQQACAVRWWLDNPVSAVALGWKKSVALWSSWYGPIAQGSMARNPYLNIHPVKALVTTQEMADLVLGPIGKLVEWMWLVGGLLLMFIGTFALWRVGGVERAIGAAAMLFVAGSWLMTLITTGDHRYRLPFMGLSLLLQVVGAMALVNRGMLRRSDSDTTAGPRRSGRLVSQSERVVDTGTQVVVAGAALSKSARRKRR